MMNAEDILYQFETLKKRVEMLAMKIKETERKLKASENENIELKNTIKQLELNLKNLQKNQGNQQKDFQKREFFTKLVQNTGGVSDDTSELKKTLDNYIKEIESCIAKLSN
jgi:septal ring factor EnvC (AmiA/AmiB activator)